MPGNVRPVSDERDGLLAYLDQQRHAIRIQAHGLTDEQLSATPTVSSLCIAGVIKHVAHVERGWMVVNTAGRELPEPAPAYEDQFRLVDGETIADVLAFYDRVASETEAIVDELGLDHPVPVPDAPWFPKDVEAWSLRWVLLHLIEETARHGGHADIIREAIDGGTFYDVMAAAEGA